MSVRLILAAERRRMPWKNGGGETFEIACQPDAGRLADFDWRISMASMASDGPFSVFPGIDRTIAIVRGRLELRVEGRDPAVLCPASPPLPFLGEVATRARLVEGPVIDLNVMTRRSGFTHSVDRVVLTAPLSVRSAQGRLFAICALGKVEETASGLLASAEDTLACAPASGLDLRPLSQTATMLLVRIAASRADR